MLSFLTKKKAIDKYEKEIRLSEVLEKEILGRTSESTIRRYIEKTKMGELDFPYIQYTPKGDYWFLEKDLRRWKRSKKG